MKEIQYKDYEYKFDKRLCPWAGVCKRNMDDACDFGCGKYTGYNFITGNSLLPERWRMPIEFLTSEDHEDYKAHMRCFEIKDNIVDFVKSGKQLIIRGDSTGTGKTHMAIKMMLAYIGKICYTSDFRPRALFIQVDELFNEQKLSFNTKITDYFDYVMKAYEDVDLVVWDDICVKKMSDMQYSLFFTMVNNRVFAGKSNIFTTNRSIEELFNILGDRLFSRIVRPAEVIEFKSSVDFRSEGGNIFGSNGGDDKSAVDNISTDKSTSE